MFGIGRKKQAFATIFAVGGRALVFPLRGISADCDLVQRSDLNDPTGLGQAVFDALAASTPLRSKTLSLGEQTRAFEDTMEAFRGEVKMGQRRFAEALAHGILRQTPEGITLTPMRAARGRYAFEKGGEDVPIQEPASHDAAFVGRALVKMLTA